MARSETILDTTRRLEWVVTKEMFESFDFNKWIDSGVYEVKIGCQSSKWVLHLIGPRMGTITKVCKSGDLSHALHLTRDSKSNKVFIYLNFNGGESENVKVEIENIGIKSEAGYMPCDPIRTHGILIDIPMSKIVDLNEQKGLKFCRTEAGHEETFLKKFVKDKITVVAILRFYLDRNEYIEKNVMEKNFLSSLRSISDLDTLTDFTIICGGREFKCHRVILVSMSTVLKAMILNPRFVESNENSLTIKDSTPDIVEAMLEFMSKGVIPGDIEEKAIDLIALADKYDLQDLIKICESSLADNITVENVIETLIAFDHHVPNSEYRQKILDFIKAEGEQVVKSKDWNKFVVEYPALVTEIFLSLLRAPSSVAGN